MNWRLSSPYQLGMAYLLLWMLLIGVLYLDGSTELSPVAMVVWLAVAVWWSTGSRIAQWILLLGTAWTAIAIIIVDMAQPQDVGAVLALVILLMQFILLIWSFWSPRRGHPT